MRYPPYTDQSSTGLSRLMLFNSTSVLTEGHLSGERDEAFFKETLQDVSLTHPDALPFVEFIPATRRKSPSRLAWIVGVVILVAVLGMSSAIAFSRDNGFVLSLVNSPQTLTTDK